MTKLRIGIIGLGGAGRAHYNRLRRNERVGEILGFDLKSSEIPGLETVASVPEMLERVDAVSICTPDHEHLADIVRCLDSGKHVLVEKPMVASYEEAKKLESHVRRHANLKFAVHHQMRHTPAFEKARELIVEGKLGRLFYVEANYWHDMRDRSTQFDDWRMTHGQSLLFGHACHPFDLLMFLLDGPPLEHTTYLSKVGFDDYNAAYTSATSIMKFPGDVIAKSHVNSCCIYPQVNDLVVLGDKGSYIDGIFFDNATGFSQKADFFGEGKDYADINITSIRLPPKVASSALILYLKTANVLLKAYLHGMSKIATRFMRHPDFAFRHPPLSVYNHDKACQVIVDNFVAAVLDGDDVLVGYDDAARVIKLCEDTEASGLANMKPATGSRATRSV